MAKKIFITLTMLFSLILCSCRNADINDPPLVAQPPSFGEIVGIFSISFLVAFLVTFIIIKLRINDFNKLLDFPDFLHSAVYINITSFVFSIIIASILSFALQINYPESIFAKNDILFTGLLAVAYLFAEFLSFYISKFICNLMKIKHYKLKDEIKLFIYRVNFFCLFIYFNLFGLFSKYSLECLALLIGSVFWLRPTLEDFKNLRNSIRNQSAPILIMASLIILLITSETILDEEETRFNISCAGIMLGFLVSCIGSLIKHIKTQDINKEKKAG